MNSIEEITKFYRAHSFRPNNIFPLLRPPLALRYIADGIIGGHSFLGIEGFHLIDGYKIQPDQELSTDFEGVEPESSHPFWERTGKILFENLKSKEVVFEVVFDNLI